MKSLLAVTLVCLFALGAPIGTAAAFENCTERPDVQAQEIHPAADSGFPLAPVRDDELWALTGYAGDFERGRSATAAATLGLECDPWLSLRQKSRLGIYLGAIGGEWGEPGHVPVSAELAVRYHLSFVMDDFLDVYGTLRLGGQAAFRDFRFALRPAAGLGLRMLRAVVLEGVYAPLVAVGDRFDDGRRFEHGIAISLGLDLCVIIPGLHGCQAAPAPPAAPRPLTCALYTQARQLCGKWSPNPSVRQAFCRATAAAMNAATTSTSERYDSIDALLRALAHNVSADSQELRAEVDALRVLHEQLLKRWSLARCDERQAARDGALLATHTSYAPVAVELREYLGCTTQGEPAACPPPPDCAP
jgi:hypothetical protein